MDALRPPIPPRSVLVLAACALLVLAFAPAQYFGRQQDDVLYLVGARALASGRYCLLSSPGCPPLTMIDPGWPALMTPLALFTERPSAYQAFSALLLAAAPIALWAWLRRRTGEIEALLAAALFASCPLVLAQSGAVMSEIPFVLALIAALAAAEAEAPGAVGLAGAVLLATRTAGLAALPALFFPFARSRRWRALAAAAVPPAAYWAGWAAWSHARAGTLGKFDLLPATYGDGVAGKLLSVAAANARYYAAEWGGCFLSPSRSDGALAVVAGAALAAAAAVGLVPALRRRADEPAAWALLGSVAMLAVWGWQYERYLIPLVPLLLWALLQALGRAAKPVLGALLVLQLGAQTLPRLTRPSPWAQPELARTYAWLASRPRPALLSSAEPIRDGYLSGLPSVALPVVETGAEFAAALKAERVAYVLRTSDVDFGLQADPSSRLRRSLDRAYGFLEDVRRFRKVHEEPGETAEVYEPL